MKNKITVLLALFLILLSCKSTQKQRRAIPRDKSGKETIYHLDDLILFYNNATGHIYVDLLYLKNSDVFIFSFTNTEEPEMVLIKGKMVSGDVTSDLVRVEREVPKFQAKRKKPAAENDESNKKKKIKLKPVPTENLFKVEKAALERLFAKDTTTIIILEGKKENSVRTYRLDFDKSDLIAIQNFYKLLTTDDK